VTKSLHSESSSCEDEKDPYSDEALMLKVAQGQPADGFKYRPDTKEYVLPDFFALP
jgi:hypothetical protein